MELNSGCEEEGPLPTDTVRFPSAPSDAARRFRESMAMDYEKWRDGVGYDLAALAEMSGEERREVEALISSRGVADWRDVEALAALDGARQRAALREALVSGPVAARLEVLRRMPSLAGAAERTACMVDALRAATMFDGSMQAIGLAVGHHPPEVITALWEGLERRPGDVAVHFAALLYRLYGLSKSTFDLAHRPFFLSFNTDDVDARRTAIAELRRRTEGRAVTPPIRRARPSRES